MLKLYFFNGLVIVFVIKFQESVLNGCSYDIMDFRRAFLIIGILVGQQILAQTCCSEGVPLSNNLGLSNEGRGILIMGLNYDHNDLNTLKAGGDRLDDDYRKRVINFVLLNLGYNLTDRWSLEAFFIWVNQKRAINQFGSTNVTETQGLGDAVFLVKYAVPDILGTRTVLNFGVSAKAPVGKSDLTTDQGLQLTTDLQP